MSSKNTKKTSFAAAAAYYIDRYLYNYFYRWFWRMRKEDNTFKDKRGLWKRLSSVVTLENVKDLITFIVMMLIVGAAVVGFWYWWHVYDGGVLIWDSDT